jgi:hypothetical protein
MTQLWDSEVDRLVINALFRKRVVRWQPLSIARSPLIPRLASPPYQKVATCLLLVYLSGPPTPLAEDASSKLFSNTWTRILTLAVYTGGRFTSYADVRVVILIKPGSYHMIIWFSFHRRTWSPHVFSILPSTEVRHALVAPMACIWAEHTTAVSELIPGFIAFI